MTLNEILRACFIVFTPSASHSAHLWCSLEPWLDLLANFKSRRFFPSSAPVFQRQCFSATWIHWVFRPFSFEHYTNHWALGCPRTSKAVYANIQPEAALTIRMRDQMHLKVSVFLTRGRNGPLNGHMAAADVAVWRSVLRGCMNMVWIQLLLFQSQLEVKMFSLSPDWNCPSLIF